MSHQHTENLLIRYRGKTVNIKTVSGGVYEGAVVDVTNDYVALDYVTLKEKSGTSDENTVIIMLHSIEAIAPRA